ncbi:MAG: hypothetical protein ACT4OK_14315 [Gemmobacter sp.]
MRNRIVLAAALAFVPGVSSAFSAFERMVLEELSCAHSPNPTAILRALIEAQKIDLAENIGYDSMSCWKIKGGIAVAGMTFYSVCAFEEDERVRGYNEDLYYRGPGTSPGQMISFGAAVSGDVLSDWYVSIFGPTNVNSAIAEGDDTALQEPSEVTCSGWMHSLR